MCHSNQPSKITQIELPVTRSNTFKCELCDLEFMTENGQKVHRDLEHQIKAKEQSSFQCKHCVIKCSDAEVLRKHTNREHNFKCQRCNSYFGAESYLQNHMKTVHDNSYTRRKKIQ